MNPSEPQYIISASCETDLSAYGDTFRGAGYTKSEQEAAERYTLMLGVIRESGAPLSILDLGCGLGHLADFMTSRSEFSHHRYTGLDISPRYLAAARARRPDVEFLLLDVLDSSGELPVFDYVILNGVFNYRGPIAYDTMLAYWQRLMTVAYAHCRRGLAFNVMSSLVDWQRDDLFHLPLDVMSSFVWSKLSRHFVVRHDYAACEYVTYVYREPSALNP